MAKQRTTAAQGDGRNSPTVAELNLRDPASYTTSIDWIRDNVVFKNNVKGPVLQLIVSLPGGDVSLYMNPANHYIMAFRGRDKIYVLKDRDSEKFKNDLQSQIKDVEIEILHGLSAAHTARGLGTFKDQDHRTRATVFSIHDLESVSRLSTYSRESGATYELLKRPLSLLICMIAESARIPMMQRDFANMFHGHDVVADEAIQSYDDAKYLMTLARDLFPDYPRALGVEKLQKRAVELDALLAKIQAAVSVTDRKKMIADLLNGRTPSDSRLVAEEIKRFRDICAVLSKTPKMNADDITQLISTCKSNSAVRAAKQGVVIPEIGKAQHAGS